MTRITQLPEATTITNAATLVIVDGGTTKRISYQTFRTTGLKGDTGIQGIQGPVGPLGPTGTAATIQVGTVTAGQTAAVTNVGNANAAVFNFVVPYGPKGDTGTYVPVTATSVTLGGVKIGEGISITADGTISATTATQYVLPPATTTTLGGVKAGNGVTVSDTGTISVDVYSLPTASDTVLGGVKIGAGVSISNGVISVTTGAFALQTATNTILGGVKIGTGLTSTPDGTARVAPATGSSLGGIVVGLGLVVDGNGVLTGDATTIQGGTLSSNVTASSLTSVGSLQGLTVKGTTTLQQTLEVYTTLTNAFNVVVHDYSKGAIFVHDAPLGNFTVNLTNVPLTGNNVSVVALVIKQGVTAFIPSALKVNGVDQVIKWQGGITPTGNNSKTDLVNFTIFLNTGTSYTVLGSLSSFG